MPSYPNRYIKGDPDTTQTGSALINKKSIRKYCAVTLDINGWRYSGVGDAVHGSLYGVSDGHLQICAQGQDIKFRNGGTASIVIGSKIIGATRVITSGGTAQNGYIAQFVSGVTDASSATNINAQIDRAAQSRGIVVAGGATPTANTEAASDVLVALSYGLIV